MPASKASSLTHRPALSKAGESLSPAADAAVFGDCHLHLQAALQSTPGSALQGTFYCEQMPARGNPWNGGFDIQLKSVMGREFKILGSVISPFQNKTQLIPAWSQWDWQDTSMLWIIQALNVLPMPINVQLSQNTACTYWFNMKENLLSALGGSFHSLGHIQLCPAQLPINHIWDKVLCLHPPWICLSLFCTMTFLLLLLMVDSPPYYIFYQRLQHCAQDNGSLTGWRL